MQSNVAENQTNEAAEAVSDAPIAAIRVAVRLADTTPWLLVPEGMSCQFFERPTLSSIPNVKPWFVGAFAERGVITPVFDLSRWLDDARPAQARGLIVVRNGAELIGFLSLDAPKVVNGVATGDGHPNPVAADSAISPFCGKVFAVQSEDCIEFHPFEWVRANAARISIAA